MTDIIDDFINVAAPLTATTGIVALLWSGIERCETAAKHTPQIGQKNVLEYKALVKIFKPAANDLYLLADKDLQKIYDDTLAAMRQNPAHAFFKQGRKVRSYALIAISISIACYFGNQLRPRQ